MSRPRSNSVPHVVDDLYASTLDDSAWSRALVRLCDFTGASGTNLVAQDPRTGVILRDESHRIDPAMSAAYRAHWSTRDILLKPFLKLPVGVVKPEYRLVKAEDWRGSALFNELAAPAGLPHVAVSLLHRSPDKIVALSLKASSKHGPFERPELRRLAALIPHIRRTLTIRDRLEQMQVGANTIAQSFSALSFGVMVLDGRGRAIEVSAVARAILANKEGIEVSRDGSVVVRGEAGRTISRWITSGTPPETSADGLLKIPQTSGQALSLMMSPLPANIYSWIGGDPRWLWLLFDPERRIRVSQTLLEEDLRISSREAEVAARLATGADLQEIANTLCISLHTARTHLKAIYSKTGIRSQIELIQRITRGPAANG